MNKKRFYDYVKDHVTYFGFFPCDYAEFNSKGEEEKIIKYPEYMDLFTKKQIEELAEIFYNHPDYKTI